MRKTAQSEFHPLGTVLLNDVQRAFRSDEKLEDEWRDLNFLGKPDYEKAKVEYSQFEAMLRQEGVEVHYLPDNADTTADALYCRDASIITDHGAILCAMGKKSRGAEPGIHRRFYEDQGIPIIGNIEDPGTLEGGDTAWIGDSAVAVGHSYRTNTGGIRQLKKILRPYGIELIVAELPHYKGPGDVLHLMSVFSPVGNDLALVYSPLLPISFRQELLARKFRLIEVPEQEFGTLGCNVLALGPRKCVMLEGNPRTQSSLEHLGYDVQLYRGEEISIKGSGGPTCLTRPLHRLS